MNDSLLSLEGALQHLRRLKNTFTDLIGSG
jgi:hypothetical protein